MARLLFLTAATIFVFGLNGIIESSKIFDHIFPGNNTPKLAVAREIGVHSQSIDNQPDHQPAFILAKQSDAVETSQENNNNHNLNQSPTPDIAIDFLTTIQPTLEASFSLAGKIKSSTAFVKFGEESSDTQARLIEDTQKSKMPNIVPNDTNLLLSTVQSTITEVVHNDNILLEYPDILLGNQSTFKYNCKVLQCQNGATCFTREGMEMCKCGWQYTGIECEKTLPLYLVYCLIGCSVLVIILFLINVAVCSKMMGRKQKKCKSIERHLDPIEAFNKTDANAIYADPSTYFGMVTGHVISKTLPRPKLQLERFEDGMTSSRSNSPPKNHDELQTVTTRAQSSNGSYSTFRRSDFKPDS